MGTKPFLKDWGLFVLSSTVAVICLFLGLIDSFREWLHVPNIDSRLFFVATLALPLLERTIKISIELVKSNSLSTPYYVKISQDIDSIKAAISPIGVFKKITDTTIWKFEDEIWGWNPNWALELKTTDRKLKNGLNKIHLERIEDTNIKKINYIFLDGYKIKDKDGNDIDMDFSIDKFCEYLTQIANKKQYRNKINQKYHIWIIPENEWKKGGSLHQLIKTYRDFIVITGSKEGQLAATFFMNYHWCCDVIGHKYFFELLYHADLVTIFHQFVKDVCQQLNSKSILERKISYDTTTKKYKLEA